MKIATTTSLICLLIFLFSNLGIAQSDVKTFNTLSFFYIDNSEGFDSSPLNAAINNEVGQEFIKKLSALSDKPDNYFLLLGSNGQSPKISTNAKSLLGSDWVKKSLARTSKEADYKTEKDLLRESLTNISLKIKKEVNVYAYLSGYALSQLAKKMEEFPTPVFFPKEMLIYLNNPGLNFNIFLYTNEDAAEKLTPAKIRSYFNFCDADLKINNFDVDVQPF